MVTPTALVTSDRTRVLSRNPTIGRSVYRILSRNRTISRSVFRDLKKIKVGKLVPHEKG